MEWGVEAVSAGGGARGVRIRAAAWTRHARCAQIDRDVTRAWYGVNPPEICGLRHYSVDSEPPICQHQSVPRG